MMIYFWKTTPMTSKNVKHPDVFLSFSFFFELLNTGKLATIQDIFSNWWWWWWKCKCKKVFNIGKTFLRRRIWIWNLENENKGQSWNWKQTKNDKENSQSKSKSKSRSNLFVLNRKKFKFCSKFKQMSLTKNNKKQSSLTSIWCRQAKKQVNKQFNLIISN